MKRKDLNKPYYDGDTPRRLLEDFKRRHPKLYVVLFDGIALTIIAFILIFAWFGFCSYLVLLRS